MKVLLIQSPQVHRNVISLAGKEIPMNLAYLAAGLEHPKVLIDSYGSDLLDTTLNYVENENTTVEILDLQLYPNLYTVLNQKLEQFHPDIVGITAFTIQANWVNKIASRVKKFDSNILTLFGGVHAFHYPSNHWPKCQ